MTRTNAGILVLRRQELISGTMKQTLSTTVKELSVKYEVPENTIYEDWQARESWIKDILKLDDPSLPTQHLIGLNDVINESWFVYNTTKSIGALRLIKETHGLILDLMVKAGYFNKEQAADAYNEIKLSWASTKEEGIKNSKAQEHSLT
jgi:hypothetical protein